MAHLQLLLAPAFAVMGIAFLFNLVLRRFADSRYRETVFGLMFGGAIVIGMTNPMQFGEGIIFDPRSLLIGAAVTFVGPLAGLIAAGIGVICRVFIGGAGLPAGVLGIVLAYPLAILCVKWVVPRFKTPWLGDAAFGMCLTLTIFALYALPFEVANRLITSFAPMLLVSNVIGMIILGFVFRREIALEKRRLELEEHATRDPLTNLLNRRGLQTVARGRRFNPRIGQAVLYFDVDNFKQINDRHGHDIGDAVLEVIATRINDNLRSDAIFARQGGDEFSIYLTDVAEGDVGAIADRICGLVGENALAVCGKQIRASISMGGYWSKLNHGLDELLRRADAQLLLAKQAGKNRAQVAFDPKSSLVSVA